MNQVAALTTDGAARRSDVAPVRQAEPVVVTDSFLAMIERAARDPAVDIDKMERLMQMREREYARSAEREFNVAMAEMQPHLPVVQQNGTITIYGKDDVNRTKPPIQSTKFAKWEDINEAITPVLREHGFSLTFSAAKEADRVIVKGFVRHIAGHKEMTELSLALDTSGSKNNVQAVGSSISYGKRYAAGLLLNITSRDRIEADDDGKAAGSPAGPALITEQQVMDMRDLLDSTGSNITLFLKAAKVERLEDIQADRFGPLCEVIKQRAAARGTK